ncbi:MAG TPA: tannase/feruloyl esterase family alpha/beta hydrolase [Candidatus Sulfotelmatobacter sp.]|jgi:feruloyl esterase|nr:tannase/feruloyl esterase family alpha/beta hydrolase [Candidatus Sulfotelmatobacter sp.]
MKRTQARAVLCALALATFVLVSYSFALADDSCEKLAGEKIDEATITLAKTVEAGTFVGPRQVFTELDITSFYKGLPGFCRISAIAKPRADSNIRIEIWLPLSGWNGKLQGIGNGGFAGLIDYMQLGWAVSKGYVATATDAGHEGSPIDASWALGHPEKVVDFGHRGIHEMTRVAKEMVQAFYGKAPQRSYFAGCSDGGREALMEAQRYPADYDGILAGAPANNWTPLLATAVWDTQALTVDAASFIPPTKIPAISAAVVDACDGLDGVHDGILNDPRQCHFDPAKMQCKAGEDTDKCLTAPQAAALKKIYAGPHDAHGHEVFPGYLPGAEDGQGGWGIWITGPEPVKSLMAFFGLGYFSNMVYEKRDWDYKTFTLEAGLKAADDKTAKALNAVDADMKAFKARGGKLIMYHGWDDPAISSLNTINYYKNVIAKMGQADADSFVRLYMVPGMQHCDNGPGADSFGQVGQLRFDNPEHSVDAALEQWVEKGTAPSTIIAAKYTEKDKEHPKMTRPLCAYPQVAKYKGSGDTFNAGSFSCEAGAK